MITQLTLGIALRDDANFNNFYPGKNTQLVHYLRETKDAFIYLWGEPSCGLTHLLQAICWQTEHCLYLPLRLKHEFNPAILEGVENLDLLAIDDIEQIVGDAAWEEALFHAYNRLQQAKKRLVMSSHQPAKSLAFKLADWQSRFMSATALEIQALDDEEKIMALQLHAKQRGLNLPSEVAQFLLRRYERSLSTMIALLDRLDHASLVEQRKLTIPFVKDVLGI